MAVNWNTPGAEDNSLAYFQLGTKLGEGIRERQALAKFARNPDDPEALAGVMAVRPELGMKLSEFQDKRAFSNALAEYVAGGGVEGGGTNALLGFGLSGAGPSSRAPRPTVAPFSPAQEEQSFNQAFSHLPDPTTQPQGGAIPGQMPPMHGLISGHGGGTFDTSSLQVTSTGRSGDPMTPDAPADNTSDLSFLGQPQTGRDRAFLRMVQRYPEKALKIQSTLRDNFVGRMEAEHKFYSMAVDELSRARDDTGWQSGLARLEPYAAALGADLGESVPLTYPGEEGVKRLLQQAMPIKQRLDHLMQQANIDTDNARADRNTNSLIATREGRLAETRRNNELRNATVQRGQDIRSSDTRRGQDTRGSGAGGRAQIVAVKTPEEARALPQGTRFRTPDGRVKVR
ncbi:hypothetical protein U8326_00080 [Tsuneonella sp. CC-YZS046]|uniref:hypothetical protein n=1 Tax=Tsuneonella sp. CC-YZS046 TaxID=3042152 RepID=UPI002D769ACD|nr:hypothetical protein [Tsuneonella sp. CC-YZS046]WRO66601.1 hypothetical protein U8326_00080 [Tsuneonella sp. CC-YZS046]